MLTPQEVSDRKFGKSMLGGYNMSQVDVFLEEVTKDYGTLYQENEDLKSKMKLLVDKLSEYRETEQSMRTTLFSAQKTAGIMIEEARKNAQDIQDAAQKQAENLIRDTRESLKKEEAKLEEARRKTSDFLARIRVICEQHLIFLETVPDLEWEDEEPAEEAAQPAEEPDSSAAAPEEAAENAEASANPPQSEDPYDEISTEEGSNFPPKLDNLQFGRNYKQ